MTQRKRELTHTLTIRLPEPVLKRLRAQAAREHRKVSAYVRLTLEEADKRGGLALLQDIEGRKS